MKCYSAPGNEVMPSAATWMPLEVILIGRTYHLITTYVGYVWKIQHQSLNQVMNNRLVVEWGIMVSWPKCSYVESSPTENYIQYLINHNGEKYCKTITAVQQKLTL